MTTPRPRRLPLRRPRMLDDPVEPGPGTGTSPPTPGTGTIVVPTGTGTEPAVVPRRLSVRARDPVTREPLYAGTGTLRRQVWLTTLCDTLDNFGRRLARRVPGTGSGGWMYAGTGTFRRQVWEFAECAVSTGTGDGATNGIPPGHVPEGGPLLCCPDGYGPDGGPFPGILRARFLRRFGVGNDPPGDIFIDDDPPGCCQVHEMDVPLYYVDLGDGNPFYAFYGRLSEKCWEMLGPFGYPTGASQDTIFQAALSCTPNDDGPPTWNFGFYVMRFPSGSPAPALSFIFAGDPCPYTYKRRCDEAFCIEFGHFFPDGFNDPAGVIPTARDPRCALVVQQTSVGQSFEWTCHQERPLAGNPAQNDIYQVTVFDPALSGGRCPPSFPASGTGTIPVTGTGTGTVDTPFNDDIDWEFPPEKVPNRGLTKRTRVFVNGRYVWLGACCPPEAVDVGTGTGPVTTPCCPDDPVNQHLSTGAFTVTSGSCDELNGVSFTLDYASGMTWQGIGTGLTSGDTFIISLTCGSGGWEVTIQNLTNGGLTFTQTGTLVVVCSPTLQITWTGTYAACVGATLSLTIEE